MCHRRGTTASPGRRNRGRVYAARVRFLGAVPIDIVCGPQGGAMIPYRVGVTASGAVPECVGVTATLEVDGDVGEPFVSRLALHCGTSLAVFAIFPFPDRLCETDVPIVTTLHVEVAGIGEASAVLEFMSQGCPNRQ